MPWRQPREASQQFVYDLGGSPTVRRPAGWWALRETAGFPHSGRVCPRGPSEGRRTIFVVSRREAGAGVKQDGGAFAVALARRVVKQRLVLPVHLVGAHAVRQQHTKRIRPQEIPLAGRVDSRHAKARAEHTCEQIGAVCAHCERRADSVCIAWICRDATPFRVEQTDPDNVNGSALHGQPRWIILCARCENRRAVVAWFRGRAGCCGPHDVPRWQYAVRRHRGRQRNVRVRAAGIIKSCRLIGKRSALSERKWE